MSWLITPNIPTDLPLEGSNAYLRRHRSTRQMVECSIGILKAKFPCLNFLRLKTPEQCCNVILACITLYNVQNVTKRKNDCFENTDTNEIIFEQDISTTGDEIISDIVAQFEAE